MKAYRNATLPVRLMPSQVPPARKSLPGKNISVRILGDINGHLKRMEMRCSRRPRQVFVSITAKNSSKGCFRFNAKVMIWRTHNAYLGCSRDQKPTHISGYCVRRVNELH